jgi:fucose 4-O-acetylase-like acetyltransferase
MLFLVHIFLMAGASLCFCAGVGMAMFGRKKKFWLTWHKRFNTAGICLFFAGAATALIHVETSGGKHLAGLHHQVGSAAFFLASGTLVQAYFMLKAANRRTARATHRWLGRVSLFAVGCALVSGLFMIGIL